MPHALLEPVETETYSIRLIAGELVIECKLCDAPPSYSRGDVTHRFCAKCNLFLDTLEERTTIHISSGCEACAAYRGE